MELNFIVFISALAFYLIIFGVLLSITQKLRLELLFLGVALISSGLVLLSIQMEQAKLMYELSSLIFWPLFYLFSSFQYKQKLSRIKLMYLLIPLLWLSIFFVFSQVVRDGLFDVMQLLVLVVFVWLSLADIYQTMSIKSKRLQYKGAYLAWLFYGLIAVVILRLSLSVFNISTADVNQLFYTVLGLYLTGISAFLIKSPGTSWRHNVENIEKANYEELLKRKLQKLMLKDKVFLNPELTLQELANLMNLKLNELSAFINTHLGKNFNDFINEYRINEFKQRVKSPATDSKATIMELAYQSGFNSKASFNRLFKEYTGITPSQFKKGKDPIVKD